MCGFWQRGRSFVLATSIVRGQHPAGQGQDQQEGSAQILESAMHVSSTISMKAAPIFCGPYSMVVFHPPSTSFSTYSSHARLSRHFEISIRMESCMAIFAWRTSSWMAMRRYGLFTLLSCIIGVSNLSHRIIPPNVSCIDLKTPIDLKTLMRYFTIDDHVLLYPYTPYTAVSDCCV